MTESNVPIWEVILELRTKVGRTLVAVVAGTNDRDDVTRWLNGSEAPSCEQGERIRLALELFNVVAQHNDDDVARGWFLGANTPIPEGEFPPAMAIRWNSPEKARESARRMINDLPLLP